MSDPLHQTLMCILKGKILAYIVNVIPIMSERAGAVKWNCPQGARRPSLVRPYSTNKTDSGGARERLRLREGESLGRRSPVGTPA